MRPAVLVAFALVPLLSGLRGGAARAVEPSFEGIGRAAISGGDRVKARERALDEAFRHTLEAAISSLLGPETLTRRAADLRLKIMPRARSYVTSYRVLDEGETEPGFFSVHVGGEVQSERLVRELGSAAPVVTQKTVPTIAARVGLCVRVGGEPVPLPRFEEALQARLLAQGMLPGDSACDGDPAKATLFAELTSGEASRVRGTSFVGREARLALRLVDSRRTVEGHGQGAGFGATPLVALDDAALAALPEATAPIDEALGSAGPRASSSGEVVVHVAGVRKLVQLTTVRTAIERLPGITSVELRRFAAAGGPVDLLVHTAQPVHAVSESLQRVAPTYRLRVREADGGIVVDVPDASDALPPAGTP